MAGDVLARRREAARPLPPPGSPNVLLVVLDTVRADHLGSYGYERPTTPNLDRLARTSIRFAEARATAPWTLASHASLFTGRTPGELGIRWMRPLRRGVPTLSEYLGTLGYSTAGFVGNTFYCSYDSGLDRGFTHYEDYELGRPSSVHTLHLADLTLNALGRLGRALGPWWAERTLFIRQFTHGDRKDAAQVNRQLLAWLDGRSGTSRPFFAFLNYADAHSPYVLPPGAPYGFGVRPRSASDFWFLLEGWTRVEQAAAQPAGPGPGPRFVRQLPRLPGRTVRRADRRARAPRRTGADRAHHRRRSWRRLRRARSLRSRREPVPPRDPRAAVHLAPLGRGGRSRRGALRQSPRHPGDRRRARVAGHAITLPRPIAHAYLAALIARDASRSCGPVRARVAKSLRPQQGPFPGERGAAGFDRRGRFRLYPEPGRWE